MNIFPIRTEQDYKNALREVSRLVELDPAPDSEEGARLEVIGTLVEAYEQKHFPIDLPSPAEAIKFRMEQGGLVPADLVPSIGRINRVYEVLSGKRAPSVKMIRSLHLNFGIPAESLIGLAEKVEVKVVTTRITKVRGPHTSKKRILKKAPQSDAAHSL